MSKYHKTDGGLWPNKDKAKPTHPDMKGNVKISGSLGQASVIDLTETGAFYRERYMYC